MRKIKYKIDPDKIKVDAIIKNVNVEYKNRLTRVDKLALFVTGYVGTMGFFLLIFTWTVLWLGWNTIAPPSIRFDPYPAFVLWLFISNMIQIFLMPLIMIGQNLQSALSESRAEADFEVNVKSELSIQRILAHLEVQNKLIIKILEKLNTDKGL